MKCETCKFYDPIDADKGLCRAHAPTPQRVRPPRPGRRGREGDAVDVVQQSTTVIWGDVHKDDWCGEYKLKP